MVVTTGLIAKGLSKPAACQSCTMTSPMTAAGLIWKEDALTRALIAWLFACEPRLLEAPDGVYPWMKAGSGYRGMPWPRFHMGKAGFSMADHWRYIKDRL